MRTRATECTGFLTRYPTYLDSENDYQLDGKMADKKVGTTILAIVIYHFLGGSYTIMNFYHNNIILYY